MFRRSGRQSPTTTRSSSTSSSFWEREEHVRPAPGRERRRPAVQLHRRPGHGQQDARGAHRVGADAQGRVPALQGAAGLPPALPERLRLPGPLDRGRRRAGAGPQLQAGDRGVRPRGVRQEVPRASSSGRQPSSPRARSASASGWTGATTTSRSPTRTSSTSGASSRSSTSGAGCTAATAPPSGARDAARRSRRTSWPAATSTARTRRCRCASRWSTGPARRVVIWTTTPWTLPANVAAAVQPDADYGRLPTATGSRSPGRRDRDVRGDEEGPRAGRLALPRPLRRARPGRRRSSTASSAGTRWRSTKAPASSTSRPAAAPRTSSSARSRTCRCSRRSTRRAASSRRTAGSPGAARTRRPTTSSRTSASASCSSTPARSPTAIPSAGGATRR